MRSTAVFSTCLLGLSLAACGGGGGEASGAPDTGRDVLEAMAEEHRGSRYRTLTFVQRTVSFGPDGAAPDTTTWYEALAPRRLRIDVAPREEGNGLLYRDGVRYTIQGGVPVDSTRDTNPLAVLLADVFHDPVERTATILDSLGFDLSVVRDGEWRGEPVWVVGAPAGDTTSSQFWVERARLLPVRVVDRLDRGPLMDARIGGYTRIQGSWVETELEIYVDGRLAQLEEYRQVSVDPELPDGLFDPYSWTIRAPYWE